MSDLTEIQLQRAAALKFAIGLYNGRPADDVPSSDELVALADWIVTGMPEIAQGNSRVRSQNYTIINREAP